MRVLRTAFAEFFAQLSQNSSHSFRRIPRTAFAEFLTQLSQNYSHSFHRITHTAFTELSAQPSQKIPTCQFMVQARRRKAHHIIVVAPDPPDKNAESPLNSIGSRLVIGLFQ